MKEEISVMQAMMDDEFQEILQKDEILDQLEQEKYNRRDEFFELMQVLSKTCTIDGVAVSCITPAIWAYLFAIGSPYTTGGDVHEIDTDIFFYILHNGIQKVERTLVDDASGFCEKNGVNCAVAEQDVKTLIYFSFRPLEMLSGVDGKGEQARFDIDWLTYIVSTVAPMTNKTSDDIIFNMSLAECFSYCIQKARQYDTHNQIRRRNSSEINEAIYIRTMELGKKYWEEHYR